MSEEINTQNLDFIEQLYAAYLENPDQLPEQWQRYFSSWAGAGRGNGHGVVRLGPPFRPSSIFNPPLPAEVVNARQDQSAVKLQHRIDQLLWNYRLQGHLIAQIDPLGFNNRPNIPELAPEFFAFTAADLAAELPLNPLPHRDVRTLGDLFATLREIYAGHIGVEYMHINDPAVRAWVQRRLEATIEPPLKPAEKRHFLKRLTDAAMFDQSCPAEVHRLEGVFARRGRGRSSRCWTRRSRRPPSRASRDRARHGPPRPPERAGQHPRQAYERDLRRVRGHIVPKLDGRRGDVKYHLGYCTDRATRARGSKIHVVAVLQPQPPRSRQSRGRGPRCGPSRTAIGDIDTRRHGRCSSTATPPSPAKGSSQETLNCRQLRGYPPAERSTSSSTTRSASPPPPADAPFERVLHRRRQDDRGADLPRQRRRPRGRGAGRRLAMDFRQQFHATWSSTCTATAGTGTTRATSPHSPSRSCTSGSRAGRPSATCMPRVWWLKEPSPTSMSQQIQAECTEHLEAEYALAQQGDVSGPSYETTDVWRGYRAGHEPIDDQVVTAIARHAAFGDSGGLVPDAAAISTCIPSSEKWMARRREMARVKRRWIGRPARCWPSATSGRRRTSRSGSAGQDATRGTFSQRHAVLYDYQARATRYAAPAPRRTDQARVRHLQQPAVARPACSASTTATASTTPRCSSSGRPSSATSPTARR